MIKLQEYTPEVYYKSSRDFQFIGRLFDVLFNYAKTNTDTLYSLPLSDNSNKEVTELLALTLGFSPKYNYTTEQLRAICSTFSLALRNKGSITSIINVCNALLHAEGIEQEVEYELKNSNTELVITVSQDLSDITILSDVLSYLVPAGMSYTILKELILKEYPKTEVGIGADQVKIYSNGDYDDDTRVYRNNKYAGLGDIAGEKKANIKEDLAKDTVGLLNNSVVYKPED